MHRKSFTQCCFLLERDEPWKGAGFVNGARLVAEDLGDLDRWCWDLTVMVLGSRVAERDVILYYMPMPGGWRVIS